ncbi:MAG TPA: hypothetical protein VGS01_07450 [Candidatus Limnocylindria bacterium]|jgi:hypothetical protein|nr:hypothetical protein [Candidatus Limnocylindria bacterium]
MSADTSANTQTHETSMHTAKTTPLLFVPRHIRGRDIRQQVHGTSAIGGFNAAVAVFITKVVGTMYCAYVFTLIAFVALPAALQQGSPTVLVNWLSSNFLQLVLLPIILVGQNVISRAQDARADADHETLTALHELAKLQIDILEGQNKILELLKQKAG